MKRLLLVFFATFSVLLGLAQGTKITVFQPGSNSVTNEDSKTSEKDRHCLKWNYSLLCRGVFLFNYEMYYSDKVTFEFGLGLTYRDFIFEMMKESNLNNNSISFINSSYGNPVLHPCIEAGLRYYPKSFDNFEGFYLSPMLSYRPYSFDGQGDLLSYPAGTAPTGFKAGYSFVDLQLKFGIQYSSFWNDDVVTDFYVGLGIRSANINELVANTNALTGATTYQGSNTSTVYPTFLLGFKIGFPF